MGNCASARGSSVIEDESYTQDNIQIINHFNGCTRFASVYSQEGTKSINQDAAVFYQGFGARGRSFFGVYDGHGKYGHIVSKLVKNRLPALILSQQDSFARNEYGSLSTSDCTNACVNAFELMDKEIHPRTNLDCSWSGTTAVTIIMQGEDLVISNLGDSRAILGTFTDNDELISVQLTTDLKPNVQDEADRILNANGRIFALEAEQNIQRVWLPNDDMPGLAMTRCFGDFGIKDYGIIAKPQMSCHRVTDKDRFLVLATDGVWDVLKNDEVASIVWSVTNAEEAAKAVVDAAVLAWKEKHPTLKIDDCTVVCLFLQEISPSHHVNSESTGIVQ
ncbi:hypothetical protein ACHQM5_001923 [Ranunculus cassubicifolius]